LRSSPLTRSSPRKITFASPKVEIVSTANAYQLLNGSGPGVRPDGPTLDTLGLPGVSREAGVGLRLRCKPAAPAFRRAVVVPPGAAAAAMARVKARMAPECPRKAFRAAISSQLPGAHISPAPAAPGQPASDA
ncbi:unnamed protein product, partial [Polarella glacialis]